MASPSPVWFLAEGATHTGFDLFYLVQNPGGATPTSGPVLAAVPAIPRQDVPRPAHSRFNIWVDLEQFPHGTGGTLALAKSDLSAFSNPPTTRCRCIVERAMYLAPAGQGGPRFAAGHGAPE